MEGGVPPASSTPEATTVETEVASGLPLLLATPKRNHPFVCVVAEQKIVALHAVAGRGEEFSSSWPDAHIANHSHAMPDEALFGFGENVAHLGGHELIVGPALRDFCIAMDLGHTPQLQDAILDMVNRLQSGTPGGVIEWGAHLTRTFSIVGDAFNCLLCHQYNISGQSRESHNGSKRHVRKILRYATFVLYNITCIMMQHIRVPARTPACCFMQMHNYHMCTDLYTYT